MKTNDFFEKTNDFLQLKRPIKIIYTPDVIRQLSEAYNQKKEIGGLIELKPINQTTLSAIKFHFVANRSVFTTSFNPDNISWKNTIKAIRNNGNIPQAVHTHPTKLGIKVYDNRTADFYLRSSKPDQNIARKPLFENYLMPEMIFVKDPSFKSGFGLALYEGNILPDSIHRFSDLQIFALASMAISRIVFKSDLIFASSLGVFALQFAKRAKYEYLPDRSVSVDIP